MLGRAIIAVLLMLSFLVLYSLGGITYNLDKHILQCIVVVRPTVHERFVHKWKVYAVDMTLVDANAIEIYCPRDYHDLYLGHDIVRGIWKMLTHSTFVS